MILKRQYSTGGTFQVERCLNDRKYVQITNNSLTIDAARQDCRGQKADAFSPLSTREHAGGRHSGKQGMLCLCWLSPSRSGLQHFATNVHVCPPFLGNAPGMLDGTTSRGRRTRHANPFGPSVLRKVIVGRTDSHGVHYSHFPAIHTSKIGSNPAGRILHPQPVLLGAITPPTAQTRADHHVPSGQTVFVFRSAHSTRSRLLRQASVTGLAAYILTRGHAEPTRSSTTSYQFSEPLPRSCPPISPGLSV